MIAELASACNGDNLVAVMDDLVHPFISQQEAGGPIRLCGLEQASPSACPALHTDGSALLPDAEDHARAVLLL